MTDASEPEILEGEVVEEDAGEADTTPPTPADLGIELPDDPDEAIDLLVAKLAEARADADSYLDDLRRVAADFDNFRKRATRDQQETTQRAAERILVELLPALDSFDAAVAVEVSTDAEEKLIGGMYRTQDQLLNVLRQEGLEVVPSVGEPFDPEVHEAVMSPSEGGGRLIVSRELRRGYILKGRLVRPALVALEYEGS